MKKTDGVKSPKLTTRETRLCCIVNTAYVCKTCKAKICLQCNANDEQFIKDNTDLTDYQPEYGKLLRRIGHLSNACIELPDPDWREVE